MVWGQHTFQLKIIESKYKSETESISVKFILYKDFFSTAPNLSLHDTHLYVNDQAVQVTKLSKQKSRLPIKTLFVLDNSGSMSANNRFTLAVEDMKRVIELLPPNSLAGLIRISDSIRYITPGNLKDKKKFRDMIRVDAKGNTPLFDGIYTALRFVQKQKDGIFSIFAFTDGLDEYSRYTAEDCLQLNEKLHIPIIIFFYNDLTISKSNNLIRLANLSGGDFFSMETEILHHYPQIPIGTFYTVTAYCPPFILEPKWQNIKIEVFYNKEILTAKTGLMKEVNHSSNKTKKWIPLKTHNIVIGIFILSLILLIIWVLYLTNKKAKTKKCPFCSKRYDIHLDSCPYCHQSTMNFYTKSDGQIEVNSEFPIFYDNQEYENEIIKTKASTPVDSQSFEINEERTKLLTDDTPTLAYLVITKGDRVGLEYPLHQGVNTIGRRAENSIVIEDPAISAFHLKIWQNDNGAFIINDLATTNGTYVNDQKIVQQELKDKDKITLGQTVLTFFQIEK